MSRRRADKGDVLWHVPNRKKPIAYSTTSTRDLINAIAENGNTLNDVRAKFDSLIYDAEATAVLDEYIKRGFGEWIYCDNSFRSPEKR